MAFCFRKRGAVVPGPASAADRTAGDGDRCVRSEELCGLQQRAERHQPHRLGLHDDRRAVLRQWGELGRGEVPALWLVGGMCTHTC